MAVIAWPANRRGPAGLMIGEVRQPDHARHARAQHRFDALAEGDLGEAAALAAAVESKPDPSRRSISTRVACPRWGGDDGIDLAIQDVAHLIGQVSGRACRPRLAARSDQPDARDLRNGVADQLLDAPEKRQAGAGRPANLERDGAVSTPRTRISPPRAITDGRTLARSAAATLSARSKRGLQVGNEIAERLDPDGNPQEIVGHRRRRSFHAEPVLDQALHAAASDVARLKSSTAARTAIACAGPPASRIESMPPKPPLIWRAEISWPGCDGRPG